MVTRKLAAFLVGTVACLALAAVARPQAAVTAALFSAVQRPEMQAAAAVLDMSINGAAEAGLSYPGGEGHPGGALAAVLTITNQGSIPGDICLIPPPIMPPGLWIKTPPTCQAGILPGGAARFSLEWEILADERGAAIQDYRLPVWVSLRSGFVIEKEVVFSGPVSRPAARAAATQAPTQAPSVPPTATSVPPTETRKVVSPSAPTAKPKATQTPLPTETRPPSPTPAATLPPSATSLPPTATSLPPTATSVPPTATSLPPTATSLPPTATSVPPTAAPAEPLPTTAPSALPAP